MRLRRRRRTVDPAELRAAWRAFQPSLAGLRPKMVLAVGLSLAVTALELLRPWPITWVVDHLVAGAANDATGATSGATSGVTSGAQVAVAPILVFAAIAFCVPAVGGVLTERLQLVVAQISRKATVRIRADVFEHIHRLEFPRHQRHFSGDLLVRLMGDVNMVRDLLFSSWLTLLSHGMLLIGSAVVFGLVDWRLLLLALAPLPLLAVEMRRTSRAVRVAAGRSRKKEGAIASSAAESIRNVGLVKAFAAEARTADRFRATARSAERATMATARHSAAMTRRTEILTGAGVAGVLVVGAMRVRSGEVSPGELILAVSYTRSLYKPLRKITTEGARLGKATACASRVQDLLQQPVEDATVGKPVPALTGDVEFDRVSHRYPDGRASLWDLTVRLPGRSLIAVSGENGAGKSTLLSLLLRLHQPSSGEVRIGGTPIDEYRLDEYRERIAFVPQQLSLFSGTIRENIAYGKPDASGAEVLAAAEAALLLPVLATLPDGIDTELNESGGSLSGGQARRVMLARAAVRDASIVLLDEPLVGLDPPARALVIAAIRNIARRRTTIVVHHGDLDELAPDVHLDLARSGAGAATRATITVPVTTVPVTTMPERTVPERTVPETGTPGSGNPLPPPAFAPPDVAGALR